MINQNNLKEFDKGRLVIYTEKETGKKDEGRITSWNDTYIFVSFWGSGGQACRPEDLEFSLSAT